MTEAAKLPATLVLHNSGDLVVSPSISRALVASFDKTLVEHEAVFYDDFNPALGNHPFKSGGPADFDSRKRTIACLSAHLRSSPAAEA